MYFHEHSVLINFTCFEENLVRLQEVRIGEEGLDLLLVVEREHSSAPGLDEGPQRLHELEQLYVHVHLSDLTPEVPDLAHSLDTSTRL